MKDDNRKELLTRLQKKIDYFFINLSILNKALTHKSFANESGGKDNEELEFLGDSIIGMLVSEYLYKHFPDYAEGKLSTIKAVVVSEPILAKRAMQLDMGKFLQFGKGEKAAGGETRPSILANCFEAFVAALYLDSNLEKCRKFVLEELKPEIEIVNSKKQGRDYKCLFQEYAQSKYGLIPDYHVVSAEGPEHKKSFEITVSLKDIVRGKGKGTNKKSAEKAAAKDAWKQIFE